VIKRLEAYLENEEDAEFKTAFSGRASLKVLYSKLQGVLPFDWELQIVCTLHKQGRFLYT
jgi:hypothetical protein